VERVAHGIRTPYLLHASVGIEHKVGTNTFLSAEFTTLRGVKLYRMRNLNAPLPATGVRPDLGFTNINQFESSGSSRSQGLSLTARTVLHNRIELLSQYTLSKTTDDTAGLFSLPADNFDLRSERGRSDFDRRHRFNFAGILSLPAGLKIGTIASVSSGIPFNITTGFDNNHDTVANDRPAGVGRNTGKGPGYANVDVRLSRRFNLRIPPGKDEKSASYLELRLDAFNVLNRVNPNNFIGTLSSPLFGQANSGLPARQLQLSAKVSF
jgi:hypothetical protein